MGFMLSFLKNVSFCVFLSLFFIFGVAYCLRKKKSQAGTNGCSRESILLSLLKTRYGREIGGAAVGSLVLFLILTGMEYAYYSARVDDYIYHKLETANQTDPRVLFDEEMPPEPEDSAEHRPELHIPARYIGSDVSQGMLDYFRLLLGSVFQDGTRVVYTAPQIAEHTLYEFSDEWSADNPFVKEADTYREYCIRTPNLANEYQYGRSLNDAGMKLDDMEFAEKLSLITECFYVYTHFLGNKDRDVGTKDKPKVIETWYVALQVGKLFLHNALVAEASVEGQEYTGCFLGEAYICFQIGVALVVEESKYYALLSYYAGNAAENILERIDPDKDPGLYQTLGWASLGYYEDAKQYCISHPKVSFDGIESFIPNVESGLGTLRAYGFS